MGPLQKKGPIALMTACIIGSKLFKYQNIQSIHCNSVLNAHLSRVKYVIDTIILLLSLDLGFFDKLDVLKYIDLSENALTSVPEAIQKSSVIQLDLSNQCYLWYQCPSFTFHLDETSFNKMTSLRVLTMRGILTRIEEDSFSSAIYMEELDVSSIFLSKIHKNAFLKNKRLRSFRCHQCWILEPIHHTTWTPLSSLEELDLSYSPHSIVSGSHAVEQKQIALYLPNLKYLNLTCSLLIDHDICDSDLYQFEAPLDPDMLKPLVGLEVLDLSKNGLTSWLHRRFDQNTRLRKLSLQNNKFKILYQAMLDDFRQLDYLDMR